MTVTTLVHQARTWLLMAVLSALLVAAGAWMGGSTGAAIAFALALVMNLSSYWFSDKLVIHMTGAQPLDPHAAPGLHEMSARLAAAAGVPTPRLYLIEEEQPNAFATGRNPANAAIAVTTGLLRILDRDEVEGVMAHEMAHIKNRDVLVGTFAAVLAGAISTLAQLAEFNLLFGGSRRDEEDEGNAGGIVGTLVGMIVLPLAAALVQMAVSRSREYLADETGAGLTGNPAGLANALLKLQMAAQQAPMAVSPASSHLFIVNPFGGIGDTLLSLFSTHPPIEDRVRRLRALEQHSPRLRAGRNPGWSY